MADTRTIKTGLFGKKNKDILNSVIGQWSDGIWENNPQMAKYWKFAEVAMPNGEVLLEISNKPGNGHIENAFPDDDAKVKEIFGRYVKAIVKQELADGLDGNWKRDCTSECDYLTRDDSNPITVKDAYYAYEVLKGRNVNKHPEYSEAFYARDIDGNDYQIEIELEDGPGAEDPEKLTVVVGGERKTVDVPKDGTDDHYKKAIAAGLKELGRYKLMEGKIPGVGEAAKKPLYAYIGYSGSWGDGDDEKTKLPAGDNYLDIVSKHFDMKPEEIDAKWRKKLVDCKTDADFGKVLAAMYDAMEAFVFALRRGNECVWANPKGSAELDDRDWQGPDYDWLTANV